MINSDDLYLITALAREKSLASLARNLNITPSAISQRLTALESRLQIKVAERTGRSGIILTTEGQFLVQQGHHILNNLSQLNDTLCERRGIVSGQLHIIASLGFGRTHLAPLVGDFQCHFPDITIKLTLSDLLGRLPKEGWDVIIRIGPLRDSALKMQKLKDNRRFLCASPDYLKGHGMPGHPSELGRHHCIAIYEDDEDVTLWHFKDREGNKVDERIKAHLSSNDGETALSWALEGRGIIMRSEWSVEQHIKNGRLVKVLPLWTLPDAPIIALTRGPEGRTKRVKKLLEFLQKKFQIQPISNF